MEPPGNTRWGRVAPPRWQPGGSRGQPATGGGVGRGGHTARLGLRAPACLPWGTHCLGSPVSETAVGFPARVRGPGKVGLRPEWSGKQVEIPGSRSDPSPTPISWTDTLSFLFHEVQPTQACPLPPPQSLISSPVSDRPSRLSPPSILCPPQGRPPSCPGDARPTCVFYFTALVTT